MRVACYVDGFNLYHAIDALGDPLLKWTDLRSLAASYLGEDDTLVRVAFFTALNTWDQAKRGRHVNFISALEATGVAQHPQLALAALAILSRQFLAELEESKDKSKDGHRTEVQHAR